MFVKNRKLFRKFFLENRNSFEKNSGKKINKNRKCLRKMEKFKSKIRQKYKILTKIQHV